MHLSSNPRYATHRAAIRTSTALAVVACTAVSTSAQADMCAVDPALGPASYYIQICRGADGAPGANGGSKQNGQPGSGGGTVGGGSLDFSRDFAGIGGKPALYFAGIGGRGGNGGSGGQIGIPAFTNGGDGGTGGSGWNFSFKLGGGTVSDGGDGLTPLTLLSIGGDGGNGGDGGERGAGGQGGEAGAGGVLSFTDSAGSTVTSSGAGIAAVSLISQGGNGGFAHQSLTTLDTAKGKPGGTGGDAGAVGATISGSVRSNGAGVQVASLAGNGGGGGDADTEIGNGAVGGDGGRGGLSGSATIVLAGGSVTATGTATPTIGPTQPAQGGTIAFSAPVAPGLHAVTAGGIGGLAGNGSGGLSKGTGGNGGSVASASTASIANQGGMVATTGYGAVGMLAQSLGGHGGNGGFGGGVFVAAGGDGNPGGDAGAVTLTGNGGLLTTTGDASSAVVGQSIGGGGGYGGDSLVRGVLIGVAVGGNSANGGNGGTVAITNGVLDTSGGNPSNGQTIATRGYKSSAIVGQSIGGGGGIAGDANAFDPGGIVTVAVGGTAGVGGNADEVVIRNGGTVQTAGPSAYGIDAQGIGGGGGSGGAANSLAIGDVLTVAAAVGGTGGKGGDAKQQVFVENDGQVLTGGSDSYGLIAQSIGGGGGHGGTAVARTIQVLNDPEIPTVNLKVALGGHGGTGGIGGRVIISNVGSILTTGTTADGIIAQSVGGGGGDGGDSDAFGQSFRSSTVSVTTTIGGQGGSGGVGGSISVGNGGFILTLGDEADGIFAQSVGGGGGLGGYGHADSGSFAENETSLQTTIAVGGVGGSGGDGGLTSVINSNGGILTRGDKARAIFAQSVGGGGGAGGGAVAKGGGGAVNINVAVGGGGGAGGNGHDVQVQNAAAVLTQGGDAAAIVAQSIGGGGGSGGTAATDDGTEPQVTVADYLAKGLGIGAGVINLGNGIYELKENTGDTWNSLGRLKDIATAYDTTNPVEPDDGKENKGGGITVSVGGGVAGNGGAAGNGGLVTVRNTGSIETGGPASEGIFAQSIGGGGGEGGATIAKNGSADISAVFAVGGRGGSGGTGGVLNLMNSGSLTTAGDLSFGIFGQSVGGGGGKGGISGGEPSAFSVASVSIGGGGGANGQGGQLTITNSGALTTTGRDAIAIIAQTIGGGGGLASLMTVADTSSGGDAGSHTGFIPKTTLVPVVIGGAGGAAGNGDHATTNLTGGILSTAGVDAYGVLAQSIGGGGGVVAGAPGRGDVHSADSVFGSGRLAGNGGNVDVTLSNAATIRTSGSGAVGILAQSLGGGGGLVGGVSQIDLGKSVQVTGTSLHSGSGNDVEIKVGAGSSILTTGTRAHGIVAQSAGGGAGLYGHADGTGFAFAGLNPVACGGAQQLPCTGAVTVSVDGSIKTTGTGAYGIYAQSRGNGGLAPNRGSETVGVQIAVNAGGLVSAEGAAAIYIDSPAGRNRITNSGTIGGASGVAFDGTSAAEIVNAGVIRGDILTSSAGYIITNQASGRLYTGKTIDSQSTFVNQGELWIGDAAKNSTIIHSDLSNSGRIVFGIDFTNGKNDILLVEGNATVGGTILVNPITLGPGTVQILYASQKLTINSLAASNYIVEGDGTVTPVDPYLYRYMVTSDSHTLSLKVAADFTPQQTNLGAARSSLATNLQSLFDSGASFDRGFNALLGVNDPASYARSLDALSGQALGALGAFRINSSRAFVGNLYGGCERHGVECVDGRCLWARAFYTSTTQDENADELGYHAHATGFQLGGETQLSERWYLSGAVAYEHSRFRDDSRTARVKGDGVLGGVSLRYATGKLELSGALDAGYGWYQSRRQIVLGGLADQARAKPNQWEVGAHANAAYTFDLGSTGYARPYADLHVIHVHSQRFTETGNSPFNLAVDAQSQTAVAGGVGLEVGGRIPLKSGGTLRPFASAGVELASNSDWTTTARFVGQAGGDSFDIRTAAPNSYGRFAVGLELLGARNVDLSLSYNPEVGKDYVSHSGLAKLTYRF